MIRSVQKKAVTAAVFDEHLAAAKGAQDTEKLALLDEIKQAQADPKAVSSLSEKAVEVKGKLDRTVNGRLSRWQSYTSIAINLGAFFGMFGFGALSQRIGRKPTFAIALISAFFSTVSVFWFLQDFWQIWVMVPVMGFCQLSLFAGYAIYFPELFPTRLRTTGTSFCYNVGRFLAALGPIVKGRLEAFFSDTPEPLRYAGMTMCFVFLIGLCVLPFLPETNGKPLPE